MLAGHKRHDYVTAMRGDAVPPELLGMKRVDCEDAIRRAFKAIGEAEGATCCAAILPFAWSRCSRSPGYC